MIIGTLNPTKTTPAIINGPRLVTKSELRERRAKKIHESRQIEYLARQVEVINICTLMDRMGIPHTMPYDQYMDQVMAWAKGANAHVYEMDREHFSIFIARREAAKKGKTKVIVSDLS